MSASHDYLILLAPEGFAPLIHPKLAKPDTSRSATWVLVHTHNEALEALHTAHMAHMEHMEVEHVLFVQASQTWKRPCMAIHLHYTIASGVALAPQDGF